MKQKLTLLILVLFTTMGAWAQRSVTYGSQITSEANIVSGKAYVLKTGNAFISDNGSTYDVLNSGSTSTERTVYYLIDNGDGTWKIKNYYTNKFWSAPTTIGANITSVEEASAGSWSLNFSNNRAYPTAMGTTITLGLERSNQKMQGWANESNGNALSTGANAQVFIYEVGAYNTLETDLNGKMITVGDAVSSITTDTWYVIKCNTPEDGGFYRGSIFENLGALYHNGNTSMDRTVKWLFRFEDAGETDKYYVKTAYGNYFTDFTNNAQIGTRTAINSKEKITIAKINSTDGHFYFQSSTSGVIMDANGLTSGTASGNVVGYTTTVPTATGGNNDWGIYAVSITDIDPIASEVYTINNTNASRGAMMYYSTGSTTYVWSSGKDSAPFDASSNNCRWIIYPSGTTGQYYLYNVGAQKFAIPTGNNSANTTSSWVFSKAAAPVTLTRQSNGTYKIQSAYATNIYASVSNGFDGPIINYNDAGAEFTLTKVAETSDAVSTQLTAAINKLIDSQTKLTAKPSSEGWYAIKIQSRTDKAGYTNNYLYTLASEYNNYPLAHANVIKLRPTIDDATYYFRIVPSGDNYIWQMPTGKYLVNSNDKYPKSSNSESAPNFIEYQDSYFRFRIRYITGGYYYDYFADAYDDFIGETSTAGRTKYDIYPINLETAGLTAWKVIIDASSTATQVSCTRSDASGLTTVYNNGYIFLPSDVTPTISDFSVTEEDGTSFGIDTENKTITAANYQTLIEDYVEANGVWTKLDLAGTVGYPRSVPANTGYLTLAKGQIDHGTYNADIYAMLKEGYTTYLTATDVVLPQEGKTYTIANYANDGTIRYLYNDNGTIKLTTESSITDDYKFVCHVNASGKFIFAMPNGNYLIWRGSSGEGQANLETAKSGNYPLQINKFPYENNEYNKATEEQAFGKLSIIGLRAEPSNFSSLVVKTSAGNTFDQANTTNFFSATSATNQYSSAWIITEASDYYNKVNLTTDGADAYASLYLPFPVTIPEGITAYAVTSHGGGYAHLDEIVSGGTLHANNATILRKEGQTSTTSIYLSPAEDAGTSYGGNLLSGTVETGVANPGTGIYVLGKINNAIGLYEYTAANLAPGKAYLNADGLGVKALFFDFEDDPDAINLTPALSEGEVEIYNVAGQRLQKMQKGINIVNGKKVLK